LELGGTGPFIPFSKPEVLVTRYPCWVTLYIKSKSFGGTCGACSLKGISGNDLRLLVASLKSCRKKRSHGDFVSKLTMESPDGRMPFQWTLFGTGQHGKKSPIEMAKNGDPSPGFLVAKVCL